ncbi:hypothetical protein R1flu_013273 [Riccia fluitans]|uniref:TFIIS central domain-containing protein n=1 Tax=Riccia fluitans TaxID=41844 RepID=A0ABD1YFZ1_9MARC
MFAMASDSGSPHPFPVEAVMVMKYPFVNFPEVKPPPEVKPHRQTVMLDENKIALESPSPKTPLVRGDNETLRKKLRESLVSALEMVVGKQVVKSVLGVGKELTEEEREVKSCPSGQIEREGEVEGLSGEESKTAGLASAAEGSVNDIKVEDVEGGTQAAEASIVLANDNWSVPRESQDEIKESPSKKAKSCKEDGIQFAEETKGGLQLMEQVKRVAWDIEANLFLAMGGVNKKYKEKARSLLFNLKDKSNPELRARVFGGEIAPQILVRMTGEQLASKELSQWRTAKAEAFASMVVLTDADVDPRRIVKKTHKGEFQVMTDAEPSVDVIEPPTSSFPSIVKKGPEEGGKVDQPPSNGSKFSGATKTNRPSPPSSDEEKQLERSEEGEDAGDGSKVDLPTIMSLDEYIDTRDEAPSQKSESSLGTQEGRNASKATGVRESTGSRTPTGSPTKILNNSTPKYSRSPSVKSAEGNSNAASVSKKRERESSGLVWEGSVQLSASRFAPVDGMLKSGERLELKDWPKSVEIKGRVRLSALDKFLQDLQLSRSRTVTVLSLCPSDRQGADLKQARAYLKEMADQYRMGDRAGFVEPAPGFELYLVAPGCSSLEVLSDLPVANSSTHEKDDEVLVGVVVWRRHQSQGVPSSRGPEHQNGSLKKVALSSQVSESPTKVNTPMHWTETSSGGALPSSLKSASAHVNVSGNSSMHSTPSRGDSSATRDLSLRREWPPASGRQVSPAGVPADRVSENVDGAVLHQSVKLEDVPPGFLPRPLPSFPVGRPAVGNVDSKEHVPLFPPPYVGGVSGPASVLPDRVGETVEAPPGFWPRQLVKGPVSSQGLHTSPLDDDDDDLPEFNFETEGVMAPQTIGNILPNQTQFAPTQTPSSARCQAPVNFANVQTGDALSVRFPGHVSTLLSPLEIQPVPPGLPPPTRHVTVVQDESFVPRPSVLPAPILDGWKSSDIRSREIVEPVLHHELPRPMPPINPDPRGVLRVGREEILHREENFHHFGLDAQRVSASGQEQQQRNGGAATLGGSVGVTPARTFYGSEGREPLATATSNDISEWCSSSVPAVQPVQRASLPSPLSYESPILIRQQQSPQVHMVLQHGVLKSNNVAPIWVRGPAPQQQEARYDYSSRQVQVTNTSTHKWQQPNLSQSHNSRSSYPPMKVEIREKERVVEPNVKETERRRGGRDRNRVRERSRERSVTPTPEREREKSSGRRRSRSRSSTPQIERSPQSRENKGSNDHVAEQKETKAPRRERERDQ